MADKGIRPYCNNLFVQTLPSRAELGNTAFRKQVMFVIMEEFGITLASAATHYNHAFLQVKKSNPELVEGLGRAEDKKGGRKAKAKPSELTAAEVLNESTEVVQTLFTVKRKSDDTVVAENIGFEDAQLLVQKAYTAKKAKLYWI